MLAAENGDKKDKDSSIDDINCLPDDDGDNDAETAHSLPLVSGMLGSILEAQIAKALDDLCPSLQSTPRLQDKAMRVVFSVGVDVLVIDSSLCAHMGKLAIGAPHLIKAKETDNVFGSFMMGAKD